MPPKDEILKIRISDTLKKEAKEFAETEGETLAVITRLALKEYMEKRKEKKALYSSAPQELPKVAEDSSEEK